MERYVLRKLYMQMFIAVLFIIDTNETSSKHLLTEEYINTNVGYLYIEILFDNTKEWNTAACYTVDEPWNAMQSERNHLRDDMLYGSISMKCPELAD